MRDWKTVKLGDVFDLQMGKTPDRKNLDFFSTTDNKWISIADISKSDKYIFETKEYISDEAVKKSGIKQIPANTVIMSFKLSIGKTAITKEPMYSNEAIMAFLPNGKYDVDNDFLYHLFSNKDWTEGSNKAVKGITLNKASLLEAKILLPPLTIQKQIAKVMDKCTEIISKNERMLENYDSLIKSRFIEMFGEPIENTKSWKKEPLGNCCLLKAGKAIKASELADKNKEHPYPCFGGNGIRGYIGKKSHTGKIVLIGRQGALCGNVQLTDGDFYATEHAVVTTPKTELNSTWLYHLLFLMDLNRYKSGAAQPGLTVEKLNTVPLMIVPLKLQNDFAAFVQQIDKSKFAVQKSLEKAETLYKSLMQEYFG